ncbi:ubiquitin-specific protease ubp1 [Xanthoria parietina]
MNTAREYERYLRQTAEELHRQIQYTWSTTIISVLLLICLAYQILPRLGSRVSELLWNSAIYATLKRFICALKTTSIPTSMDYVRQSAESSESQTHAQKSGPVMRMLGLDGVGLLSRFQPTKRIPISGTSLRSKSNNKPPGLGNWDNSCYQNSVIQGLASLPSFAAFLDGASSAHPHVSTKAALKDIIEKLKDHSNLGAMFWTPAQLKSMSSWQQQDAQEYFSKLMDEVEKETVQKSCETGNHAGLAALQTPISARAESPAAEIDRIKKLQSSLPRETRALRQLPDELYPVLARNPLEGLLAQRVGCLKCGFVEGLSLIPFNCLTLPLGKQWLYDIRDCLDEYTVLEPINGVKCAKCTLLQSRTQLEKLRKQVSGDSGQEPQSSASLASEALMASVDGRLNSVTEALDNEDFSDNTILKKCQIHQRAQVSSTKTRQAVIARAPTSLAIHINRSVFNEMTGALSKNYADVRFPLRFSLAAWCLGGRPTVAENGENDERWNTNPGESMLHEEILDDAHNGSSQTYELRAALTHYGRHENGHYICYRRHEFNTEATPATPKDVVSSWWRFSDEEVSIVSEDNVLAQGDIFMLFYERVNDPWPTSEHPTLPVEQLGPDLPVINQDLKTTDGTVLDLAGDDCPTAQASAQNVETEDTEKAIYNTVRPRDALSKKAVSLGTTEAELSSETPNNERHSEHHCADNTDETPRIHSISPVIEPDQTPTSPSDSSTTNLEELTSIAPQDSHPPLLSPSLISQTDSRNISRPMRTATPRSGRGSISRGRKGMGQVSSMVTSH